MRSREVPPRSARDLLAGVQRWQRRHPRLALGLLQRLETAAREAGSHDVALDALYQRYFVLEWLGEAGALLDDLYAGLQQAEDLGLVQQAGRLLEAIGRVRYTQGDYREAMHHWGRCIELFNVSGDLRSGVEARIGLGAMYAALGDAATGARFHRDARALLGGLDDAYLQAKLALNLGVNELGSGQLDSAEAQFEHGLAEARRGGVCEYVAEAHWHLGRCARQRQDWRAAEQRTSTALQQARACRYSWLIGAALQSLAEIHEQQGRLEQACAAHEEALGHAERIGSRTQQALCCAALSRLAEQRGDLAAALRHARRQMALELQLNAELSAPDRLRQMQQYDLSEKPPVQKLLELSSAGALGKGELVPALQRVAEAAAEILRVDLVALWLREEDGLACKALHAPAGLALAPGQRLGSDTAPAYCRLQASLHDALAVHDVRLHPAAAELPGLLGPCDVRSLLEVPLQLYGENVGLVSFGQHGQRRSWTRDDVLFGSHIAHLVEHMLSDRHHQENEEKLAQVNRSLEQRVAERTAELEQALKALEDSSLTDPLTGLRNRRFLVQQLDVDASMAARRYERHSAPKAGVDADLVIFMVDIDHFKQVNDTHGHLAGDAVLLQIKARLQRVFRESDYLVRWGGEEFLIVARGTSRTHSAQLAERVRAVVADEPFELPDGTRLPRTCSVGFASYPFLVQEPRRLGWLEVVGLVDAALYAAKRAGRNGWVGLHATETASADALLALLKRSARAALQHEAIGCTTSLDPAQVVAQL
jgi:diguanylate cyclase (GGDEF)-like protein